MKAFTNESSLPDRALKLCMQENVKLDCMAGDFVGIELQYVVIRV